MWETLRGRSLHDLVRNVPIYISTPIFYVNAAPHLGHLYTVILADTLKRWNQLCGREVILSTGTDEHGLKIQQAAQKSGLTPQAFCDVNSSKFRTLFDLAEISYDVFIRTTGERHKKAVQHLWNELEKKKSLYMGEYSGWYSINDESFVPESQVTRLAQSPNQSVMRSAESGHIVEWLTEKNFKFPLSKYRERLLQWLTTDEPIVPSSRYHEVLSLLEKEIADLSVSRLKDKLQWGIAVPQHPDHTIYVWIDALASYLTAIGYPQCNRAADLHIVGKDILKFHAVYWPSLLLALDYPLPKKIVAHAHWTVDKMKMSKSLGNVIDPTQLIHQYGIDAVRYYMMKEASLGEDRDFNEDALKRAYNNDLADQLGNLLFRVANDRFMPHQSVPMYGSLTAADTELTTVFSALAARVSTAYEGVELNKVSEYLLLALGHLNKYVTINAPWSEETLAERMHTVIYMTLEAYRILAILYQPLLPKTAPLLLDRLGISNHERSFADAAAWQWNQAHRPLGKPIQPPFRRQRDL